MAYYFDPIGQGEKVVFSEKVKETIGFQEKARKDLGFLVKSQGNFCEHVCIDPVSIIYSKQAPPPRTEKTTG